MSDTIIYYYSHVSPWSFMGHAPLAQLAAEMGCDIDYRPVSTRRIFPKTGGVPVAQRPPERQAYRMTELRRWSRKRGVPLNLEPRHFPTDDQPAARLALTAKAAGHDIAALSGALMRACWIEERQLADEETLAAIADSVGLDGSALLAASKEDKAEALLHQSCEQALADGCFGVPWYIYRDEPYWGQDRLELLREALASG